MAKTKANFSVLLVGLMLCVGLALIDSVNASIGLAGSASVYYPSGMAYDSGKGEIFVGTPRGAIEVISDASFGSVAEIPLNGDPYHIAYDSGKSEIFVANEGTRAVSVISDINNSIVKTINISAYGNPKCLAYDPGKGEIFVGCDSVIPFESGMFWSSPMPLTQ
jgi:DNA-binding beta-propeller fold protein YncE